jgi:hypothetical protein
MKAALALCALIALGASARADDSTQRHLLAGVRAFKAQHYDEALVELRVVQLAADAPADLAFYLGPTLVKLGRDREAIAVFVTSRVAADPLADFFLGEAYYHARLYRKARGVFAGLRARGLGPALDDAAARYIAAIDAAYAITPGDSVVDAYVALAHDTEDAVLAGEIWDEARLVDTISTRHARAADIRAALDAAWEIARTTHSLAALQAIARSGGAHAADAASMLASPPP